MGDSDMEGMAFYEIRADDRPKEVDFSIWITGIALYGGHFKVGPTAMRGAPKPKPR